MAGENERQRLKDWFTTNRGHLHESLELAYDQENGQHYRATKDISATEQQAAQLCTCPFSLSLSFLSLLDTPPAKIRNCSAESVCVHLVDKVPNAVQSYFFLCEQRLRGEEGFWYPYIATLPKEDKMTTPWWFEDEDLKWLLGTNIHIAPGEEKSGVEMRRRMWWGQWEEGRTVMEGAGVDVGEYTWELFLWAATIFSSRSFTSHIFTPTQSETAPRKESFALLYPVLDTFNHKFGAKVLWNMDKGDFELSAVESSKAGEEVFNNYAPKGNEELLNGYGFCIPDNPCDEVTLRIGRPPEAVHASLREQYPSRFSSADWTDDAATFFLRGSNHYSGGYPQTDVYLRGIPPELLATIRAILDFSFKQQGEELSEEHLDPAAVDAILERLIAKYQGIRQWDEGLPIEPQNAKQRVANIYREGQLGILEEMIGELQEYLEQF